MQICMDINNNKWVFTQIKTKIKYDKKTLHKALGIIFDLDVVDII